MFSEFRAAIVISIGACIALVIGFSFPALTESTSSVSADAKEQATAKAEKAHCEATLNGVDCVCYGRVAGHVRSNEQPNAQGFRYANQTDLARNQASSNC